MPYNTKFWQIGDSETTNGSFAMEVTRAKRKLVQIKDNNGYGRDILPCNIVPAFRLIWEAAFS